MQLTVLTYNVRLGTFNPLGLEGVARLIERLRPDIVGLQEVNVHRYGTGPVDQPRSLARRLRMESAFAAALEFPEKNIPGQVGYYGVAALSRFPLARSEIHRLPKAAAANEQRVVLAASLQTPAGPLGLFVTHWGLDPSERAAQAEATSAFCRSWWPEGPALLLGDFNAFPESPEIATVRAAFVDAWELAAVPRERRVSFPSGPASGTTPDGWSGAIDYVFVSPGVAVERIEVIHDEGRASDHNPVLATLRL